MKEINLIVVGTQTPAYFKDICSHSQLKTNLIYVDQVKDLQAYDCVPPEVTADHLSPTFYDYDCFARIEKLYVQNKIQPSFFKFKDKKHQVGAEVFLSLHLKQISNVKEESNADLSVWSSVFSHYRKTKPYLRFLMVGHDPVSAEIAASSNVICAKDNPALTLVDHLQLIHQSRGFLGMSSGLCQMAIFSQVPYLIYKNPNHHFEDMNRILKKNKLFGFSTDTQSLYQENESFERITQFIDQLKL